MSSADADLVLAGGRIRTQAHPSGFVQALAVRDGDIRALGRDDEIRELVGRRTRVIDLRGRLALPAFGDVHVHAVAGGLESRRCNLLGLRTRADCLAAVAAYAAGLDGGAWVLGGGWTMAAFPGGLPTAADLDRVTGGRPAFLPNRDHHSAWVNTAALRTAGIDATTPDPPDGRAPAGPAGTGGRQRGVPGHDGQADAGRGVRDVHRGHVVSLPERSRPPHRPRRPVVHRTRDAGRGHTAAGAGFQLHFHAIGDRAVSTALDALAARPSAQRRAARHHLAHLQFITPQDAGRFRALDAVANFQPLWATADPQMEELTIPFVGAERAAWQYRIGELARLGTRIAFGSDWPVSSADPLQEIHVAVNRVLSERLGRRGGPECDNPFQPEQAIGLDAAIDAFTTGVAWVNHQEDVAGRLLPGMRADVAVLDQDLYQIPARDIGGTSVVMTVAGGEVVFGSDSA